MDGTSLTPQEIKLQELKNIFPEVFAEGKVDWEKLKATLGEDINFSNERYVLNWAGKSDAFKVLQTPSTKTLIPVKEESVNFEETENIFIEGENLEVLKVLQKSYFGKVKMIYIDPPYNTGNDHFIYPDKFSETKAEYEKRVGDKDEDGYMTKDGMFKKNSKENGQYHSNWLNMMYPRLFLAKNLLKEDGVIFISIDDNEAHNLIMIMNEIFGEENFIANITWEKRYGRSNDAKLMSSVTEHLILFRKSDSVKDLREPRSEKNNKDYSNPDNDPRGPWTSVSFVSQRTKSERANLAYSIINPFTGKEYEHPTNSWKYNKSKYDEMLSDNRFYWGKNNDQDFPRIKRFLIELPEGIVPVNLWKHSETGTTDQGTKEVVELIGKNIFPYPKPISFLQRMIKMGSQEGDIILDFFSGSGTLAHAVLDMNKENEARKFICVQLDEKNEDKSEAKKSGYNTIADVAKQRIRLASKKIAKQLLEKEKKIQSEIPFSNENRSFKADLGFKVLKLSESNFKQWSQVNTRDAKALEEQMQLFVDPVSEKATVENMVYELLLKSGKDLNSKLVLQDEVYKVNNNELVLLLKTVNQELITQVIDAKPQKVIALDKLFKNNDQLKTNTVLQMKDAGVEFKTI
ncbi:MULTISPECIES: site-specific DNA-methyltransferase [unclassified Leeuwenhoekiella]|uniref:site-specific DNA-methyltransferase n=1 Tax=unclassified Leeuwenhoekiella TaxID=2615029 RepID=UPI000C617516|nr:MULTISPECIES: site-specific DNA-methyltransferase [unclassified Leeuwenhoekiella]MAW94300.1 site-specific DNA-methyltransferase [Leeuwenhoekiella sp.]MBA82981.1 site-specific DNA-methyltransferase [Leeuwenhoekiella sp.]|tara:strand:- start:9219 stop:11108 length:1890 start_codon:yes stop_codon:yes gene_type:complete